MEATGVSPRIAGRYRVRQRIGSGGTATVLLAEDRVLRRRVALKRLRSGGSEDDRRRVVREARLGAALTHPNLATIFDVIDSEDDTIVVMEYVDGQPLSEAIGNDGLDPERVVEILRPVASALDYAHRYGVIHRDVKPSNILIGDDGTVKLVDLGAATAAEMTRITTENKVVGTLAYLAPERLAGGDRSGRKADVYSLAATAFEALTGATPRAAGSVAEAVVQSASEHAPDIRDRWAAAPAGLARTLQRGMDPDPDRRQPTAAQLVADIEATATPDETATRPLAAALPLSPPSDTDLPASRDRVPWIAAAALAAVAAATIAAIALAGGGGGGAGGQPGHHASGSKPKETTKGADSAHKGDGQAANAPSDTGPAPPPSAPASSTPTGAELNDQGYALIQSGDYAGAVPILRRAVAAFPKGTTDINYAYALFNLGHALRMAGDPAAAIPILEQRLRIPDQTDVVQRELDAARAQLAGGTEKAKPPKPPTKHGPPGLKEKPRWCAARAAQEGSRGRLELREGLQRHIEAQPGSSSVELDPREMTKIRRMRRD